MIAKLAGESKMPVDIAIDMVQDVTGDRVKAVNCFFVVAADELDQLYKPTLNATVIDLAPKVIESIRLREGMGITALINRMACYAAFPDIRVASLSKFEELRLWCKEAIVVVHLLKEIAKAE
jgi:hypothetical protein